ncbi:hypothetical protein J4E85_001324 [Alternaria conjuncta]|uniref:uncharacterized protein n=1 Tax=Alternaria conjuncta TaxID=181017 RepID=UPI0022205AD8|nr:uncharacterized protein J4E85_001324 [Alternaria conjuncta]KAI4935996.1 hypothetical protein J4E85_001324 [Alternaria conjuncta]
MALPHANEPVRPITGVSGAVSTSSNFSSCQESNEPPRPSRDILDFIPGLLPYVTRLEWLENRNCELSSATTDANQKRIAAEKLLEDRTMEIDKKREELREARELHAIQLQVRDKAMSEIEAKLARQEEEAKDSGLRPRWIPNSEGPDADLYDAVWALGDKTDKAMREMRTLVAGRGRPEQAFSRWEKTFCLQNIKLVQLDERLRSKQDKQNQEIKEQEAMLEAREGVVTDTESRLNMAKESLENDRQAFSLEQSQWRDGRARNLEGTDLEVVQQLWLQAKEEQIIPALRAEARSLATIEVENQLEPVHRAACAEAKSEGHTEGMAEALQVLEERERAAHEAGSASGRDAGKIEGHETGRYEGYATGRFEGFRDGYEAGESEGVKRGRNESQAQAEAKWKTKVISAEKKCHAEGRSVGMAEGEAKGYAEGLASASVIARVAGKKEGVVEGKRLAQVAKDESFFRGYHLGVLLPLWAHPSVYQADGQPTESHPYWRGRAVGQFIKSRDE